MRNISDPQNFSFDASPTILVTGDETDQLRLARDFLSNPERYLRHLRARD